MAQHFCKLLAIKQFLHFYFLTNFMSAFPRTDPELVEDISFFASSEFLYFYLFILLIIIVNRFDVFTKLLFGAKNLPPQPLLLHHRVLSYQPLVRGENFQNCAAASICCKIDKKILIHICQSQISTIPTKKISTNISLQILVWFQVRTIRNNQSEDTQWNHVLVVAKIFLIMGRLTFI